MLKRPHFVFAGVPADSFSDDGQLWGNPIYDWETTKKQITLGGFIVLKRESSSTTFFVSTTLKASQIIGKFVGITRQRMMVVGIFGPGRALFDVVRDELGELPIIAENLGYIDAKAEQLLTDTAFPGMKIIFEFGFYDTEGKSIDAPHNCNKNSVAYNAHMITKWLMVGTIT